MKRQRSNELSIVQRTRRLFLTKNIMISVPEEKKTHEITFLCSLLFFLSPISLSSCCCVAAVAATFHIPIQDCLAFIVVVNGYNSLSLSRLGTSIRW